MRRVRSTLVLVALLLGCSSAFFRASPPTGGDADRVEFTPLERVVFSTLSEELRQASRSTQIPWSKHVEKHGIRLHLVKPASVFEEETNTIDLWADSLAFYLCVLPSGVFPEEPFRSSQVDPTLNMIWLMETEATPLVRTIMFIEDLSYLLATQQDTKQASDHPAAHFFYIHNAMLATYFALNDLTSCQWEAAVAASVAEQRQCIAAEQLNPETILDFGVPGDGWRIQKLFGDLPDRDRSYLLWLMMSHANLSRMVWLDQADSFVECPIPESMWDS